MESLRNKIIDLIMLGTFIFVFTLIEIGFISASTCPQGVYPCNDKVQFVNTKPAGVTNINYSSINVNNSNYLNGYNSSSFVPYSGAINNLDIGNFNFSAYLLSIHILNGHSPILVGDNFTFYNPNGQASINNVTSICYKDGSCINSSNNYVPYTGATGDVDLGSHSLTLDNYIYGGGFNTAGQFGINSNGYNGNSATGLTVLNDTGINIKSYTLLLQKYRNENLVFYPITEDWDGNNLDLPDLGKITNINRFRDLYLNRTAYINNIIINGTSGNVSGINNICYSNGTNCNIQDNSTIARTNIINTFTKNQVFNQNITNATTIIMQEISGACNLNINHSICSNVTGTYIIG